MKSVFLILALTISGCSGYISYEAKVGDCFMDNIRDGTILIFKVIKVGKYSLSTLGSDGQMYTHEGTDIRHKVDCFNSFPNK